MARATSSPMVRHGNKMATCPAGNNLSAVSIASDATVMTTASAAAAYISSDCRRRFRQTTRASSDARTTLIEAQPQIAISSPDQKA